MSNVLKHIFLFVCIALFARICVSELHQEDMMFDPVDTEDSAVIQQGSDAVRYQDAVVVTHGKSSNLCSEQRNGKKGHPGKYFSIECMFTRVSTHLYFSQYATTKHIRQVTNGYDYLFYKEINPPPPKNC